KESTIKTLLGRLVDKEALETTKEGRRFIYTAKISENDSMSSYTSDILSRVCQKDNGKVAYDLVQHANLSQNDIQQLMELLQEKALTAPEEVACECAVGQCDCH